MTSKGIRGKIRSIEMRVIKKSFRKEKESELEIKGWHLRCTITTGRYLRNRN